MADPVTALVVSSIVSAGTGFVAQKSAKDAADAQSQSSQNLLERNQENQRQALVENSKRLQRNKDRQLAQLRVSQAAGGFNTTSGTPLSLFGQIETRIDEQVDEQTSQALDAIGRTQAQRDSLAFSDSVRDSSHSSNQLASGVKGAVGFVSSYGQNYRRTGRGINPFGVFD